MGKRTIVVCVHFLSKCVPKSSKLVVFGGENGQGFRGNTEIFVFGNGQKSEVALVWISRNNEVIRELTGLGYSAYKVSFF